VTLLSALFTAPQRAKTARRSCSSSATSPPSHVSDAKPRTHRWSRRFCVSCARWPCSAARPLACSPAASADSFATEVSSSPVPAGICSRLCAVGLQPAKIIKILDEKKYQDELYEV